MKGKTIYVITLENEEGKRFSYVDVCQNRNNLVGIFPTNAITINACTTRKEADLIAREWNNTWSTQGKYCYEIERKYS